MGIKSHLSDSKIDLAPFWTRSLWFWKFRNTALSLPFTQKSQDGGTTQVQLKMCSGNGRSNREPAVRSAHLNLHRLLGRHHWDRRQITLSFKRQCWTTMWNRLEFLSWSSLCLSPDIPGWITCSITFTSHDKQVFKPLLTLFPSPRWWKSAQRGRERFISFNPTLFRRCLAAMTYAVLSFQWCWHSFYFVVDCLLQFATTFIQTFLGALCEEHDAHWPESVHHHWMMSSLSNPFQSSENIQHFQVYIFTLVAAFWFLSQQAHHPRFYSLFIAMVTSCLCVFSRTRFILLV